MNTLAGPCLAAALIVGAASPLASGARQAAPNTIRNPGAELGRGVSDTGGVVPRIPGWMKTGQFTVVRYGASGGFPDATVGKAIRGGKNFFAGGPANPNSGARQLLALASRARAIDAGDLTATLSGYLGGYSGQRDSLTVTATFLDGSGQKLGTIQIGPVTPAQRKNVTGLFPRTARAAVPAKTRSAEVSLRAVRTDGSYNDGYADNLRLTFAAPIGTGP